MITLMPKVSVIIPTYNRAHLVGRAIQSVLDQTYRDFELIIVDDASTDNTEEAIRHFEDKRIVYIRHERNKGAPAARNTGIRAARGEYVAFQDSDDEWLPEKLEKQIKAFKTASTEIGLVYTGFWRIEGDKRTFSPSPNITPKEGAIHDALLKGNFVGTPSTLVKKECFEKAGMFDEKLPMLEDWELWIRISKCYCFKYIDEALAISYYNPGSVNEQGSLIEAQTLKLMLEKHFEDIKRNRGLLATYYRRIGYLLCLNGQIAQGRGYLKKAVMTYPIDVKSFLLALISLFGQRSYNKAIQGYKRIIRCC